jgi:hypothetical protein
MKRQDFYFIFFALLIFLPFLISGDLYRFYTLFNKEHGMVMSFLKFAILAMMGELLGLRLKTGAYYHQRFGVLPRAIVWGLLGITIKLAFVIFTKGTVAFLVYMGFADAPSVFAGSFSFQKLFIAFCISAFMNTIYAPVMMTLHRVTDTHIMNHGGSISSLVSPIPFGKILSGINWEVQWRFVFARTIPLFWIPMHTITFLLPESYQVLFAALLGVALGAILGVATRK